LSFIIEAIRSQKPTQKRKKKLKRLRSTNPRRLSSKGSPGGNNKSHAAPVKMCGSCASKDETQLSSDRDKWPIDKIEIGCFHQICKLLDLAVRSKEPLMNALGCFDQTEAACIKITYETRGGSGTAEEVLSKWGSRNQENNNVGALKKILKDNMQRDDVVVKIEKWEKLSVCHGCGIKFNKPH
jgi:protein-arginine kinase activator protein McsA